MGSKKDILNKKKMNELLDDQPLENQILRIYDRTRIYYNFDLGRFQGLPLKPNKFNLIAAPTIKEPTTQLGNLKFQLAVPNREELNWDELSAEQFLPFLPRDKFEDGRPIRRKYRELRAAGENQRESVVGAFLSYFNNRAHWGRKRRSKTEPLLNILFSQQQFSSSNK